MLKGLFDVEKQHYHILLKLIISVNNIRFRGLVLILCFVK